MEASGAGLGGGGDGGGQDAGDGARAGSAALPFGPASTFDSSVFGSGVTAADQPGESAAPDAPGAGEWSEGLDDNAQSLIIEAAEAHGVAPQVAHEAAQVIAARPELQSDEGFAMAVESAQLRADFPELNDPNEGEMFSRSAEALAHDLGDPELAWSPQFNRLLAMAVFGGEEDDPGQAASELGDQIMTTAHPGSSVLPFSR